MSGSFSQFIGPLAQVLGLIEGSAGGALPALLAQLERAGLGEKVHSWVGHGENRSLSTEELGRAVTPEQLEAWSAQAGTHPAALLTLLAQELPGAVHRATPEGRLPKVVVAKEPGDA